MIDESYIGANTALFNYTYYWLEVINFNITIVTAYYNA